jgi:hypothetical protein
MRPPCRSQGRLTPNCLSQRQQPQDGDFQGFRKDNDFEIAHAAETDFNFADAGSVDVPSQSRDTIRQLLLREPRSRPQSRFTDTRTDDVFWHLLKSP